jgi:RNA polymerase sigma-70 factor (ECF subfamily)
VRFYLWATDGDGMGTDDADLMRRWQCGDGRAFEDLVGRWQQPVARFVHRLTGRSDLVHDLCQEVFLRVFQAAPRYRESGGFRTWLYRIALNVSRDALRRLRRSPDRLDGVDPVGRAALADAVCEHRELAALVEQVLAELPEPLRLVVALRHDEGLSFEEIARMTETPASTLKSRFAAALARLRVRFRELGLAPEENAR